MSYLFMLYEESFFTFIHKLILQSNKFNLNHKLNQQSLMKRHEFLKHTLIPHINHNYIHKENY